MAHSIVQGWHRAFDAENRQREQERKCEKEQKQYPTYVIYVGERIVHECQEWYEAHETFVHLYALEEWGWLPLHVSLNGVHVWGITPQDLVKNPKEARRYKMNRTRYLNTCGLSDQEREECAQKKLEQIIVTIRSRMTNMKGA